MKQHQSPLLWVVFVGCFLFTGCASLTEQGREALAAGEYEKALSFFQRATEQNKSDPEALEGLRKAQQAWLERKLIDVRLLRLGNNLSDSESLLLKLIANENEWQVFPSQVAFSTQSEEINLFAQRVHERIRRWIEKDNPFAAQIELNRNRFILESALSENLSRLENRIYESGKKFCKVTEKSLEPHEYYTQLWLTQSCRIWKYQIKNKKLVNSVVLFGDLKTSDSVDGLAPELSLVLNENIKKAFLQSKWYDEKAQTVLNLKLSGFFKSKQTENPVKRSASYSVSIPYEVKRVRAKEAAKNSGALGLVFLLAGLSSNERVSDNGDGTETVYETKYRSETRVYNYEAIEMKSAKVLNGKLQASINNQNFSTDVVGTYNSVQDKHSESFANANLSPTNPLFITDKEWIISMGNVWIQQLTSELQDYWIQSFCREPVTSKNGLSLREQMHRCAYQVTSSAPEPLKQYYLKNWEITLEGWQQISKEN